MAITYKMEYYPNITNSVYGRTASPEEKEIRNKKMREIYGDLTSYNFDNNSEGVIIEIVDGKITRRIAPRDFVLKKYNRQRISENLFIFLLTDIKNGIISFDELYKDYGF